MIDLGLGIDDLKVLKDAAQESIQTNVEYMSGDKVSPLSEVAHQNYVLARLRDELIKKIDEGDTATNEYAPSSF